MSKLSPRAQELLAKKRDQERRNSAARRTAAAVEPRRRYRPTAFHVLLALCAVCLISVLAYQFTHPIGDGLDDGRTAVAVEAPKPVQVDGYTKKDGTVVKPHTRGAPK